MKYSMDTYRLYYGEKRFASSIRVKVTMKEVMNIGILRESANIAIRRYPYSVEGPFPKHISKHQLPVR